MRTNGVQDVMIASTGTAVPVVHAWDRDLSQVHHPIYYLCFCRAILRICTDVLKKDWEGEKAERIERLAGRASEAVGWFVSGDMNRDDR